MKIRYKDANLIAEKEINTQQSKERPDVIPIEVLNVRKLFGSVWSGGKSEHMHW
jgi:hypothetical protein